MKKSENVFRTLLGKVVSLKYFMIQPKQHIYGCSGSEIVVKKTFNLDHRRCTLQKYVASLQISSRHWSHVHGNLLKSREFYRFFLGINVIPFYFQFFQRMLSHPFCYLQRLRLENCEFSRFFLWGQLYRLEGNKRNALDLKEFRNQVHYRKFLRQ